MTTVSRSRGFCWNMEHTWTPRMSLTTQPLYIVHRSCGSVRLAELLLQHGANINMRNIDGRTPLHAALDGGYSDYFFDTIQLLLEHCADVNTLDNYHLTPLHTISSLSSSVRAAKLLLDHGANVHIQNGRGETPVPIASSMAHEALTRLLSEHL